MAKCKLCQGTGRIVLHRSWFTSDGYRFCKCPACEGDCYTRHQASSEWIREQRRIRKSFGIEVSHG